MTSNVSRWSNWLPVVVLFSFVPFSAQADVRLPAVISDHMVLQQDIAAPIWGWADNGEEITVSIAGQYKSAKAGADGKWMVKLDKLTTGGTHELTVKGKNTIKVADVLIGEVWLGSGQSNMAMTVSRSKDFEVEQAAANLPNIRMFRESSGPATEPQDGGSGKWEVCNAETVGNFSATAFFFGRELHKTLKVPVGLINSSVGGTPIEAWTSLDAQKELVELKPLFARWDNETATYDPEKAKAQFEKQFAAWREVAKKARADGRQPPRGPLPPVNPRKNSHHPAVLFNGKIAPLVPYAIRGAIWYQGESNRGQGVGYEQRMHALINGWRSVWEQGDFPFLFVQLAPYKYVKPPMTDPNHLLPQIWEAQTKVLAMKNTGMAVTTDITNLDDIHPKNKQDVGKRLALWALAKTYGKSDLVYSGPLYKSMKVEGNKIRIEFDHVGGGLKSRDDKPLSWFTIAAKEGDFVEATAVIDGNSVVVSSDKVAEPAAVRFGWDQLAEPNLMNAAGLPAGPFRTSR